MTLQCFRCSGSNLDTAGRCMDCGYSPSDSITASVPPTRLSKDSQITEKHDVVNHPSHYCLGGIEVLDAIEAWRLPYHLGNVVKYIARAGVKDPCKEVEDLKKAAFYLDRYIKMREAGKI